LSAIETIDGAIAVLHDYGAEIVLKITKQGDVLWVNRLANNNFTNGEGELIGVSNGNLIVYMQGLHPYESFITVLDSSGAVIDEIFLGDGFGHILFDGVSGYYGVNGYQRNITRFDQYFNPIWTLREYPTGNSFLGAKLSGFPGALTVVNGNKIMNIDSLANVFDVVELDSNHTFLGLDHQIVEFFSRPSDPGLDSVIACYGSMNAQNLNSCLMHPSSITFSNDLLPGKWEDTVEVYPITFVEQSGTHFQVNLHNSTADYCPSITTVSEITDALFQVYPLPANDVLHVNIGFSEHGSRVLECLNLQGELVFSSVVIPGTFDYSVSSLPSGIYLLRLGSQVQKIVFQH